MSVLYSTSVVNKQKYKLFLLFKHCDNLFQEIYLTILKITYSSALVDMSLYRNT